MNRLLSGLNIKDIVGSCPPVGRFHLQARHRKKLPKAEGQRLADTAHIVGYRVLTPFLHSGISLLPYSYFHIVI